MRSGGIFDYDAKRERLEEVERELEHPDVWNDAERAQALGRERALLDKTVNGIRSLTDGLGGADELLDLAEKGPTDAELSRAKAVLNATLWMADESPASRAGRNAAQTLIFGAPRASALMTEQLEAQGAAEVRAVGARLLASGQAASAVLGPKAAGAAGEAFAEALFSG